MKRNTIAESKWAEVCRPEHRMLLGHRLRREHPACPPYPPSCRVAVWVGEWTEAVSPEARRTFGPNETPWSWYATLCANRRDDGPRVVWEATVRAVHRFGTKRGDESETAIEVTVSGLSRTDCTRHVGLRLRALGYACNGRALS